MSPDLLLVAALVLALTALVLLGVSALVLETRRWRRRRSRVDLTGLTTQILSWPGPDAGRSLVLELADRVSPQTLRELAPWWERVASDARRGLRSRSWVERVRALRTLEALGARDPELVPALSDPHPRVRAAAASCASTRRSAVLADALVGALSDEDALVRANALEALARMGTVAASSLLDGLVLQLDPTETSPRPLPHSRWSAASRTTHARTTAPSFGALEVLVPLDSSGDPETAPRGVRVRTPLPPPARTLELLLRALTHTSASPVTCERLVERVLEACEHPESSVRARAWEALATLISDGLSPQLREHCLARAQVAWTDPDAATRASALAASGFARSRAVPAASARLRDRDHGVRTAASTLLRRLGGLGELALREALGSDDPYAAQAARRALGIQ